ncbi:MAG: peptidoglycan L-alanyl-D-glutamate endopeptidase CwlK [Methylophilaceae bacterium]|jgi:peptidoglycan L-alanyl-D-glutamate endopeptidase CwlK
MKNKFLARLIKYYPNFLEGYDDNYLYWKDGEKMPLNLCQLEISEHYQDAINFLDQFKFDYKKTTSNNFNSIPDGDPGRVRYEPFLKKMYGHSEGQVRKNMVAVSWMPKISKKRILVTQVNNIHQRVHAISSELELLAAKHMKFVKKIGGGFNWRFIKDSNHLSPHAFGIAIDINSKFSDYWKWANPNKITYRNKIPFEIVKIFEKYGFIWGGKWWHFDTMHFEYRPEFFDEISSPRPKKILFLTQGRNLYGSERQLANLINNIDRNQFDPIVIHSDYLSHLGFSSNNLIVRELNLSPWRKLKNIFSRYVDAIKLLKFCKDSKVDLIHCSYQWLYPYALFVSKRLNVPLIQHIRRPNNNNVYKYGYGKAQAIIVISKRIANEFSKFSSKTHIIYDSVDESFFGESNACILKKEFSLSDQILFGVVGRIYSSKKQLEFIKSAKILIDEGVNTVFFIIGKVDDIDYYKQLREYVLDNNLSDKVIFLGHRDDMVDVLSSLDVLVSFSGGSVMYEAMALSKTVISVGFTDPINASHLLDGITGFVISSSEKGNVSALMKKVALDSELRKLIGENAKRRALSHLSSEVQASRTQEIYTNLLF